MNGIESSQSTSLSAPGESHLLMKGYHRVCRILKFPCSIQLPSRRLSDIEMRILTGIPAPLDPGGALETLTTVRSLLRGEDSSKNSRSGEVLVQLTRW